MGKIKYNRIVRALDSFNRDELERLHAEIERRLIDHYKEQRGVNQKDTNKSIVPVQSEARGYLLGFMDGHTAGMTENHEYITKVFSNLSNLMFLLQRMGVFMGEIDGIVINGGMTLPVEVLHQKGIKLGDLLNRTDAIEKQLVPLLDTGEGFAGLIDYTNAQQRREAVLNLKADDKESVIALRNVIGQFPALAQDIDIVKKMNMRDRGPDPLTITMVEEVDSIYTERVEAWQAQKQTTGKAVGGKPKKEHVFAEVAKKHTYSKDSLKRIYNRFKQDQKKGQIS